MAARWFYTLICTCLAGWTASVTSASQAQNLNGVVHSSTTLRSLLTQEFRLQNNITGDYKNILTYPSNASCPQTVSIRNQTMVTESHTIIQVSASEMTVDGSVCAGADLISARMTFATADDGLAELEARYGAMQSRLAANSAAKQVFQHLASEEASVPAKSNPFNSRVGFGAGNPSERTCGPHTYGDTDFWFSIMGGHGIAWNVGEERGGAPAPPVEFSDFTRSLVILPNDGSNGSMCILMTAPVYTPAPLPNPSPTPSAEPRPSAASPAPSLAPSASSGDRDVGEVREAACFPGAATAELASGARVPLSELRVGDVVRVSATAFSPVFGFTHRDAGAAATYTTLHTAANASITLTPGHYIYASAGGVDAAATLTAAGAVRRGDVLTKGCGSRVVVTGVGVSRGARGLYNPQTLHGDIVVDGLVASTYTTALRPEAAHAALAPARAAFRVAGMGVALRGGAGAAARWLPQGSAVCY